MNPIILFIKRHSLIIGILLMYLFTWPIDLANSGVLPFQVPFVVAYLVGYGIVFASLLMTGLTLGTSGVIALLKRFLIWRMSWQWYLVAFLLAPFISVITLYLNAWISQTPIDFSTTNAYNILGPNANLVLLIIPFLISDAITNGEEIGWRGYVLPRLQMRYSALTASLILGVIEGLWHLPKPAFLPQLAMTAFAWYLIYKLALTIVRTWVYNNTRGSLLLVTLFHAAGNTANFFLPTTGTTSGNLSGRIIEALIWVAVAIVVVFIAGPARLSRTEQKQVQA